MYLLTLLRSYFNNMHKFNTPTLTVRNFKIFKEIIEPARQSEIVSSLREVVRQAPMFSPLTPSGHKMTVRMTSAGKYGWYSDALGYRYVDCHPGGKPWPAIPPLILDLWRKLVSDTRDPDCCLVNYYQDGAKMGLHQDKDEADFQWPVLSISLGDDALFRIGNIERTGKTESVWLNSGDIVIMGEAARLAHHGIDRIKMGTSRLLDKGGRINLTLRVVDA